MMLGQPYMQVARWFGATAISTFACATAAQAQPSREANYSLPSQELARSLRDVSVRSGTSVIAPSELVSGRQAPALRGRYAPRQAVEALLQGSGLRVTAVGDALVVSRNSASAGTADPPEQVAEAEPIIVTGTNLRGTQPTSPVIAISRREIEQSGATSVDQLMRTVPQNTSGGVNKENSNVILRDQDVTDHGAGLNLRGLGQRATLVLVNGRRLAPSSFGSFVDVSLIPITALERVEILTDGASAIYGSDAVGGVVNFILRQGFDGFESAAQAGVATRGGGEQLQLAQTAGHDWGSGNAMLSYEFRLENEIEAGERPFTINLRPGTFLLPRERKHSLFGTLEQDLGQRLRLGLTGSLARRTTERTIFQSISPLPIGVDARADALSLAGNLAYELSSGWRIQLDGNYGISDTTQRQTQPGGIALVNARNVRNAILEVGLRADGRLFDLPAGPVRLALGAQSRWETYRDAFRSSSIAEVVRQGDRTVRSAFGEILIPLFSELNRRPGLERLQISAAGRFDRYSRTGSTFDPKVGLLWSPVRGLNLRSSYSTSFRAPLLSEVTGAYSALYLPAFFLYADPSQAPVGSIALFLQGSNPNVVPETSRNWTVGGDWSPAFLSGFTVSFNYYDIRFDNRIALPASRVNVIGDPAFAPIVDLTPDLAALTAIVAGAQTILDATGPGFSNGHSTPADVDVVLDDRISNTALTRTRGFDIGVRYSFRIGSNAFIVDANVNHIIEFENQLTPASAVIHALDRPYQPLNWRGRGGVSWARGGWSGSLFLNFADGYVDDRTVTPRRVDGNTTVDASLSYSFGPEHGSWLRGLRIALFAENLFDNDPPRLLPEQGSTTGLGYDPVNASGRGRFVALQLRKTW